MSNRRFWLWTAVGAICLVAGVANAIMPTHGVCIATAGWTAVQAAIVIGWAVWWKHRHANPVRGGLLCALFVTFGAVLLGAAAFQIVHLGLG